jgi:hypothetical protein
LQELVFVNRTIQFGIGILSILIALSAGYYGRNQYLEAVSTYPVPVPIQTIPAYTILSLDMFELREMPRTVEALPYFQSTRDLEGKISAVSLPAGLPVPSANALAAAVFRLAAPEYEVISIPVEPVSAVGGQIRIGEQVNLYQVAMEKPATVAAGSPSSDLPLFQTILIAGNLRVVDVRTSQGVSADLGRQGKENSALNSSPQTEQVQILTLAVKPEAVEGILNALATSKKQGGLLWTTLALP